MRLLPEFRKASKFIDIGTEVYFGTVDCTVYNTFCDKVAISVYTIFTC